MDASAANNNINFNTLLQQANINPVAFLQSVDQLLEDFGPQGVADAGTERFLQKFGESLKEIINDSDLPQSIKDAANDIIDSHTGGTRCDANCASAVENSELAETVDCLCDETVEEVENECACSESESTPAPDTEAAEEAANEGGAGAPSSDSSAATGSEAAAESQNEGTAGAGGGTTAADIAADLAENDGGRREGGRSGNWLEALAMALADIQSKFLDNALAASRVMAAEADNAAPTVGGSEGSGGGEGGGEGGGTEGGGGQGTQSSAFLNAQASYTANMQLFTIFSNQVSTSIKSIGEALAGISRKQ